MESAKIRLPLHQLLRNADPEVDPSTSAASTMAQRGAANGSPKIGNAPLHAVSGPDAVPGSSGVTRSSDLPAKESNARLRSVSLQSGGRLARTAVLFFFMSIVFLAGMFIGASLIANPPARPPAADMQPGPANTTTADAAAVQLATATALPEGTLAAPGPVPAPTAAPERPAVAASAPPAPAAPVTEPTTPSVTVALTPSPIAPVRGPAAVATEPDLPEMQRQALLSRGDAFFGAGDVTSARLFYQRGADAGDATAALRLGETFDAAFLDRAQLGRVPSDPKKAVYWYRRARDLGNTDAEILLKSLSTN